MDCRILAASVMVTQAPNEGYGLGGVPGRWSMYYAGRSPAEFGLDSDKAVMASDGSRGWALPSSLLTQIFRIELATGRLQLGNRHRGRVRERNQESDLHFGRNEEMAKDVTIRVTGPIRTAPSMCRCPTEKPLHGRRRADRRDRPL